MNMSDLFIGTVSIDPGSNALTSLMTLKRDLAFAERFESARLEAQYRAGKHTWDLGYFLDVEVAQVSAMCQGAGIPLTIDIVRQPPYATSAG
jgi:hypothetical protein